MNQNRNRITTEINEIKTRLRTTGEYYNKSSTIGSTTVLPILLLYMPPSPSPNLLYSLSLFFPLCLHRNERGYLQIAKGEHQGQIQCWRVGYNFPPSVKPSRWLKEDEEPPWQKDEVLPSTARLKETQTLFLLIFFIYFISCSSFITQKRREHAVC